MATILRMPEVLANATEAVLSQWMIAEGASFSAGDILAEVETEKALVDLPAETDGILGRFLAQSGDSTIVGAPIAVIITVGETSADIDAALGGSPSAAAAVVPDAVAEAATPVAVESVMAAAPRLFASPIARQTAKNNGLDISVLSGTGPGGRIVRRDVEAALAGAPATPVLVPAAAVVVAAQPVLVAAAPAAPAASLPQTDGAGYTAIPHTGMRRAIARRLTESKSQVPHFYLTADCRVDELMALRKRVNESSSVKISVNDFVVKAAAAAFADVPEANVTWTDTHMRLYESVDISVAVATEGGLMTPVIRGIEGLSLSAVSSRITDLAGQAKAGRLRQSDLEGGSFSITNLGMYGVSEFSAILNPPQSGILAVGAAQQQAVVTDGVLGVATVMRVTLSADHRAVDGALAARWLSAFKARIENPLSILI
jgi:pyruvate dehydrogenase E2 component (dihydrolipoamide acetyltransferase)